MSLVLPLNPLAQINRLATLRKLAHLLHEDLRALVDVLVRLEDRRHGVHIIDQFAALGVFLLVELGEMVAVGGDVGGEGWVEIGLCETERSGQYRWKRSGIGASWNDKSSKFGRGSEEGETSTYLGKATFDVIEDLDCLWVRD